MLSRVCTRPLISLIGAQGPQSLAVAGSRHMATKAGSPLPPTAGQNNPKSAPSFAHVPNPAESATKGVTGLSFSFQKAQAKLPLKLYTTSGILASFIYVEAEHKNKAEVDKVGQSLADLYNELAAHRAAKDYVLSATHTREQKKVFLTSICKSLKLHPLVESFTHSMVNSNVIKEFPKMVRDYNSLLEARDHIVKVTVTLASKDQPKPKPETIRKVLNYGPESQITLDVQYDPSIAGGAIIAGPDRILDASFRKELNALNATLQKQQNEAKAAKRAAFQQALAHYAEQGILL